MPKYNTNSQPQILFSGMYFSIRSTTPSLNAVVLEQSSLNPLLISPELIIALNKLREINRINKVPINVIVTYKIPDNINEHQIDVNIFKFIADIRELLKEPINFAFIFVDQDAPFVAKVVAEVLKPTLGGKLVTVANYANALLYAEQLTVKNLSLVSKSKFS
jgi:hypothetical protein